MNSFGNTCVQLRKQGKTLNEIVKITGRAKSSVFPYIRSIPLSEKARKRIQKTATERIVEYNKKRRGISARKFKRFSSWNTKTVFLVSHLLFDGQMTRSGCIYHNRSSALIDRVQDCMREVYEREPFVHKDKETDVTRVSYYNVELGEYLKHKSEEMLQNIHSFPVKHKRAFLKAFFDDEGCMDFRATRNIRRVRGYQNDMRTLRLVKSMLADFGIDSSFKKSYVREIVITGKENLMKFRDEINFSPGVRINGKRKNSIWKKDLEKRKILDMAINSYQNNS